MLFSPLVAPLLFLVLALHSCSANLEHTQHCKHCKCPEETRASLEVKSDFLGFFANTVVNEMYNPHSGTIDGSDWPEGSRAVSMIGKRRLHNFAALVSTAIHDDIPGDIIETGVWRGGASFLAAKVVELLCDSRIVYMADSYKGIPQAPPGLKHYSGWLKDSSASRIAILNDNSVQKVQRDAELFGVASTHVAYVKGWFNESLPLLLKEQPALKFSVIRLDGDTFYSTMDALEATYAHLSPGGFVIIDDYVDWRGCRSAVDEFRTKNKITDPIVLVPHMKGENALGAYWRKDAGMGAGAGAGAGAEAGAEAETATATATAASKVWRVCVGHPTHQLRVKGSYNPENLVPMPPAGPDGVNLGSHGLKGRRDIYMCA